jgi:hypothetical protein
MEEVFDFALRVADRFALLFCQDNCEVRQLLFDGLDPFQNQLSTRLGSRIRPGGKCCGCGIDSGAGIALIAFRSAVDNLTGRRIHDLIRLSGTRTYRLTGDEHFRHTHSSPFNVLVK